MNIYINTIYDINKYRYNHKKSTHYIILNKYSSTENIEYYIEYIYKHIFKIDFNYNTNEIKMNSCYLYNTLDVLLGFTTNLLNPNIIIKDLIIEEKHYEYTYFNTYSLITNIFNIYSLYKYLLSLKYLKKKNNMQSISHVKKFNCMRNFKIITYIVATL